MHSSPDKPSAIPPDLQRYPLRKRELLQAWDAADELMLEHLAAPDLRGQRILILNDSFGALGCALEAFSPILFTDSYLAAKAIELNSRGRLKPLHCLNDLEGTFDRVLIRIPKNLSYFEDLLSHASRLLRAEGHLVCGYRVKHQAKSAFDLIHRIIGETRTSLAKKKARLILAEKVRPLTPTPYPVQVRLDGFDKPFIHHSNLFSREKLDIGTRFFLEHLPEGSFQRILDMGCANGAIGISAKMRHPDASLIFTDESSMAVESARASFENFFPHESAEFHWTHAFECGAADSVDLVLCNPPFHSGNAIDDHIAHAMFNDARRVLRPGGRLRVIGNSHLHYQGLLGRIFGNSEVVAKNAKFTIAESVIA